MKISVLAFSVIFLKLMTFLSEYLDPPIYTYFVFAYNPVDKMSVADTGGLQWFQLQPP